MLSKMPTSSQLTLWPYCTTLKEPCSALQTFSLPSRELQKAKNQPLLWKSASPQTRLSRASRCIAIPKKSQTNLETSNQSPRWSTGALKSPSRSSQSHSQPSHGRLWITASRKPPGSLQDQWHQAISTWKAATSCIGRTILNYGLQTHSLYQPK